jgi:hypothetical protein
MNGLNMWNRPAKAVIRVKDRIDRSESKLSPSDDGFHVTTREIGDFEWWYFDVYDQDTDCSLKIVAHLGTDPLRRRFYPQLAVSVRSPSVKRTLIRTYALEDFTGSTDFCDVRLKTEFRAYGGSPNEANVYHISVNADKFRANLNFDRQIEGCKPLGAEVEAEKGSKKGVFFWAIPLPKAKVVGEFSLSGKKYTIKEGLGYHDHNYWKVDRECKLFMDDIISKWYWGRSYAEGYTVIFMDVYFRQHQIKSLVIADETNIIHCSLNTTDVVPQDFRLDADLKSQYPTRITVKSLDHNNLFQMTLKAKEIVDKRDLLEGVNPVVKWLIKLLVSRPAYFGILAESVVELDNDEIKGTALYEIMSFRG